MNKNKRFNIFDWIWIIPLIVGIILQIISIVRLKQANSDINFSVFSAIFRGIILTGAVTYIFYVLPRAIGYSKQKMKEFITASCASWISWRGTTGKGASAPRSAIIWP